MGPGRGGKGARGGDGQFVLLVELDRLLVVAYEFRARSCRFTSFLGTAGGTESAPVVKLELLEVACKRARSGRCRRALGTGTDGTACFGLLSAKLAMLVVVTYEI